MQTEDMSELLETILKPAQRLERQDLESLCICPGT